MNIVEGRIVFPATVNPFLGPELEPLAQSPASIAASPNALDLQELETSAEDAIEVKVMWGADVVYVAHVTSTTSFTIGDRRCDFALPADLVGASRLPLVRAEGGAMRLLLPRAATGSLHSKGEPSRTFSDLVAAGDAVPSKDHEGVHEVVLGAGVRARVELAQANLVFELAHVAAAKRSAVGLLEGIKSESHVYTTMSALMHGLLIACFAFFLPAMKGTDGETVDRDQIDAMKPYLNAIAEREPERQDAPATDGDKEQSGGPGAAAKNEAGSLGGPRAPARDARYAIQGPSDNTDPHIARERALEEASTFGLLGIITGSTTNAPIADWARPDASGKDPKSANGNLWGSSIDDALGAGGLTLTGAGDGGGGIAEGIGLREIGMLGYDPGDGIGPGKGHGPGGPGGMARSHGILPGSYVPKGVSVRADPGFSANGRIPGDIIQRIVRQNFGRFRLCYEAGLRQNPALSGRVAVKFVIDRSGAVGMAADGGSDLPDRGVVSCVVRGFQSLSFPQPAGGMVTVNYPIVFTAGGD